MVVRPFNVLSVCAGIGGLDIAISIARSDARTVCYVEREAFSAACLVAQMDEGNLAPAPIWTDLLTFDGGPWRGVVHCVIAGLPCQPYSAAGKRLGDDDERALWPAFVRVVEEVQPECVFMENVPPFAKFFDPIKAEFESLGYKVEHDIFSAKQVGAPHLRKRFFALAYCDLKGFSRFEDIRLRDEKIYDVNGCNSGVGYSDSARRQAPGDGHGINTGAQFEEGSRIGSFPPGPSGEWSRMPDELKPALRRVADGPASRVDRLRACGNGVVPLQAAFAFSKLAQRLGMKLID